MLDHPNKKPKTDAEHAKAISDAEMALNRAIGMATKDGLRIEIDVVSPPRAPLSDAIAPPTVWCSAGHDVVEVRASRPVKA